MIGLEYICKLYDIEYKEVAKKLGISKQSINDWIKKRRPILKKHLVTLSELFDNIPEEYFQKEIDEVDKLKIQRIKSENNIQQVLNTYIDNITGEELGEEMVDDPNHLEHIEYLKYQIEIKDYEKRFEDYLKKVYNSKHFEEESIYEANKSLKLFNDFLELAEMGVDLRVIKNVLEGIRNYKSNESASSTLSKSVTHAINEYMEERAKESDELIELLKELGCSEDEIFKKDTDEK